MSSALTPAQFARHLPSCYSEYTLSDTFDMWVSLETTLSAKAINKGHLNLTDLVDIAVWGGNQYNRAGKVGRSNTDPDVVKITQDAIRKLDDPRAALRSLLVIKQWGLTYASKTLRALRPQRYAALDSLLLANINRIYLPASEVTELYSQFLDLCEEIRQVVSAPGPRQGKWFIADVEMGLFQFVWDGNRIV